MYLTTEQEEAIVKKYTRLVWSVVHRFKKRNSSYLSNQEDLYQEAMLVLIRHIRKSESLEGYQPPIRDMINAMCIHTLGEQVVSVPKRTSDYTKRINSISKAVDYSLLDSNEDEKRDSTEEAICSAIFHTFLSSLSDLDKQIVQMKLSGFRNTEVARRCGLSDVNVTRRLKRLRGQYEYFAA